MNPVDSKRSANLLAWIDGEIQDASTRALPLLDQSYLSGMGVFETIMVRDKIPLFVPEHMERLAEVARLFALNLPDPEQVVQAIKDLVTRQNMDLARVRLTLSNDIGMDGMPFRIGGRTRVTLIAFPLRTAGSGKLRLLTSPHRLNRSSSLSGMKCTSYALNALTASDARHRGADEAILLDTKGNLVGCATSNLFWAIGDELFTPDLKLGCRAGVTRDRVIRACEQIGIRWRSVIKKRDILDEANELFVTSAVRGIRGVTLLDHVEFKTGPLTTRLKRVLHLQTKRLLR